MDNYPCNHPPPPPSSSKPDRKTVEKNRRNQMKKLFTQLISLVPHAEGATSRENMSLPDQVDEATKYIKKLQIRLERLREKKSSLIESNNGRLRSTEGPECGVSPVKPPQIEVHVTGGSALQVVMTTGLDCHSTFTEAVRALHEEGAEVVNASFTTMDDSIFHTIHAQVEESPGSQVRIARIIERLKRFCFDPRLD